MKDQNNKPPKVFISYSWSSPNHQSWVIELAESLVDSGIDVVLDKWDLKIGNDSIYFMESMVTDKSIDKVIIISDRVYAEKADGRLGGVGTETQIISKRVYDEVDQERFIAVIAEKDETGNAYIPTFYHSRLYVDFSQPETYSDKFEELLRCIYGQPQHVKPPLGKKPDFLTQEAATNLGTSALSKRAMSALRDGRSYADAAFEEYLSAFSDNLERIRISVNVDELYDDHVVNSIRSFVNQRNEYIQVVTNAIRYGGPERVSANLHRFLESLLKYQEPLADARSWNELEFDNYLYIIHELFLYTAALTATLEKTEILVKLLEKPYYISSTRATPYLSSYACFYRNPNSLENRNRRLNLNRKSVSADLTKELNTSSGVSFSALMQTDFLIFLRTQIEKSGFWWPKTLVHLGYFPRGFERFIRAESRENFEKLKSILGVESKDQLASAVLALDENNSRYWGFDYGFNIGRLTNLESLDSRP